MYSKQIIGFNIQTKKLNNKIIINCFNHLQIQFSLNHSNNNFKNNLNIKNKYNFHLILISLCKIIFKILILTINIKKIMEYPIKTCQIPKISKIML